MIQLKNLKIIDSMSEETVCFTATVYKDGKRIGTAKNEGHGGPTTVFLDSGGIGDEDLEDAVDVEVYAADKKRQLDKIHRKLRRDSETGVCVGWVNDFGASYWVQGFKSKSKLADLVKTPQGLTALQSLVNRIKSELKGDETILNTNLEALGVRL